jgi:hypothetical protein
MVTAEIGDAQSLDVAGDSRFDDAGVIDQYTRDTDDSAIGDSMNCRSIQTAAREETVPDSR